MDKYQIKIIDSIAGEGLDLFSEKYSVSPDENDPHGIVVRSSKIDLGMYPRLLAVARAGAGVNNAQRPMLGLFSELATTADAAID